MLTAIVVLSLVTYRVTRFFLSDSLLEEPRIRLHSWLTAPRGHFRSEPGVMRMKLYELTVCPFCFSVWVAAGATAVADAYTSVPLPVFVWLAACSGSLVIWRWIEA